MTLKKVALSILAITMLTGALTSSITSNAKAEVLFNQKFKYFKIRGKTSQQIFRDFQKKSPIKAKGKYDATLGVAAIKLTPEVEYKTRGKRCHVANARVTADVVIHLPRWVNYKKADLVAQESWDRLFANIKGHELQHAAIAKDYAGRIERKMKKQRSRPNCDLLEADLKKTSQRFIQKHDRAQRKFDEKEYRRLLRR